MNRITQAFSFVLFLSLLWIAFPFVFYGLDEAAQARQEMRLADPVEAEIRGNVPSDRIVVFGREQTYRDHNEVLVLRGDPYILSREDYLTGDEIIYYRQEGWVEIKRNAKIRNFENHIIVTGDQAKYNLDTRDAEVNGNARFYSDTEQILLFSDRLERRYEEKEIIAENNVRIVNFQDESRLFSDYALYEMEEKMVTLSTRSKKPRVLYSDYDSTANTIVYDVENDIYYLKQDASIIGNNREIEAQEIKIIQSPSLEATLTGRVKITEYGREGSVMEGRPVRIAEANEILYTFDNDLDHFELTGNAHFIRYKVEPIFDAPGSGKARYRIEEQEGFAQTIIYSAGQNANVVLKEQAVIKQPNQVAMADYIEYELSGEQRARLEGNAKILVGYTREELQQKIEEAHQNAVGGAEPRVNRIHYRAYGEKITYYQDEDRGILEENARILIDGGQSADGERIEFFSGDNQKIIIYGGEGKAHYNDDENSAEAKTITYYDENPPVIILDKESKLIQKENNQQVKAQVVYFYGGEDEPQRRAVLMGDPDIWEDTRRITGDLIEYFEDTETKARQATIVGNAKMNDDTNQQFIDAETIDYYGVQDSDAGEFHFQGDVRYRDETRIIYCDKGEYRTKDKEEGKEEGDSQAILTGNVHLIDEDQEAFTDILRYYKFAQEDASKKDERFLLLGNVQVFFEEMKIVANSIEAHNYVPDGKTHEKYEFYLKGNPASHGKIEVIQYGDPVKYGRGKKIARKGTAYSGYYTFEENSQQTRTDYILLTGDATGVDYIERWFGTGHEIVMEMKETKGVEKTSDVYIYARNLYQTKTESKPAEDDDAAEQSVEETATGDTPEKPTMETADEEPAMADEAWSMDREAVAQRLRAAAESLPLPDSVPDTSEIDLPEQPTESDIPTDSTPSNSNGTETQGQNTEATSSNQTVEEDSTPVKDQSTSHTEQATKLIQLFLEQYFTHLLRLESAQTTGYLQLEERQKIEDFLSSFGWDVEQTITQNYYRYGGRSGVLLHEMQRLYEIVMEHFPEIMNYMAMVDGTTSITDSTLNEIVSSQDRSTQFLTTLGLIQEEGVIEPTAEERTAQEAEEARRAGHAEFQQMRYELDREQRYQDHAYNLPPIPDKDRQGSKEGYEHYIQELIGTNHGKRAWVRDNNQWRVILGEVIHFTQFERPPDTHDADPTFTSFEMMIKGVDEVAHGVELNDEGVLRKSWGNRIMMKQEEDKVAQKKLEVGLVDGDAKLEEIPQVGTAERIEYLKLTKAGTTHYDMVFFKNDVTFEDLEEDTRLEAGYVQYNQLTKFMTAHQSPIVYLNKHNATVESELMEFDQNTSMAYAKQDVKIKQQDNEVYGEWCRYDQIKQIIDVLLDVKVVQGNNVTYPRSVRYDVEAKELQLDSGSAALEVGDDQSGGAFGASGGMDFGTDIMSQTLDTARGRSRR